MAIARGWRLAAHKVNHLPVSQPAQAYTNLISFFSTRGLYTGRFKVRREFYPNSLKEILLMSRLPSSKTARIWAERIAQSEQSNVPIAPFCQLIKCSPTSFTQWKSKLAAKSQTIAFFRVQTSEPTTDSIEIKLPSGISILFKVTVNCK
jgi:hypothetical protein